MPEIIQLCASAATHNISDESVVRITIDVEFEDKSQLIDQAKFHSYVRIILTNPKNLDFSTGSHDFERKCIIVEGLRPIRLVLISVLVDGDHPWQGNMAKLHLHNISKMVFRTIARKYSNIQEHPMLYSRICLSRI
jgi:hypothetical protein